MAERWDIFCKVVDNYGDAGVCWRLSRMLASEHGLDVTLWVDRLAALAQIAPDVDPMRPAQRAHDVMIRALGPSWSGTPADVVIEAFGGGLPDGYVEAMAARSPMPAWLVLEYLSAEPWVEGAHDRASPHPQSALPRRFCFPGFSVATGGLLRERDLFARRDAFRADPAAQAALWRLLHVPPPVPDEFRISLFCYPNPMLTTLLDTWADGDAAITCLVPEGIAAGSLDRWASGAVPHPGGEPLQHGRLRILVVPFVAQDDYDRVLWACDLNFVRGEDSFVRAQWAARPFVWHLYPQADHAHTAKLRAFVDRYGAVLDLESRTAVADFFEAWNAIPGARAIDAAWLAFTATRPRLERAAPVWTDRLAELPELAGRLLASARNMLKLQVP